MEDFEDVQARLTTPNTTFPDLLAPLDGFLFFPNRGLHIHFKYRFLSALIDGTSQYELLLDGTIADGHQVDLPWYLESAGIQVSAIIVIINTLIFDTYNIEPRPWIHVYDYSEELEDELFLDYDFNDDELDRVLEMSEGVFGRPKPASRDAVEALEKVVIRSETNCGVCLEGFVFGSEATKMPCKHVFHGDCIVRWLENSCACPLCRFMLASDS